MRVCQGESESESESKSESESEGESESESESESAVREKLIEMERDRGREVLHSIYTNSRSTAHAAAMLLIIVHLISF